MQLYSHIQRARSKLSTCWDGAVYVHVLCVYLPQSACLPACWSGLAQSVIQVRPTGSGLMRIGSALSGSGPGVEAVCGAQGEKRNAVEHTSSPSLETARDAAKRSENSDLSRHNDTAQCSGFLWGAVGQGFSEDTQTSKGIKALIQGSSPNSSFFFSSSLEKAPSFSFLLCLSIFKPPNRAALLGKHVSKSC